MQVLRMSQDTTTDVCRTCLAMKGVFVSIYDPKVSSEGSYIVADMLKHLANNPPKCSDGLPDKVCIDCINEINSCHAFKIKCDNSDRKLRLLLNVTKEPVDELEFKSEETTLFGVLNQEKHSKKQRSNIINEDATQIPCSVSNGLYPAATVLGIASDKMNGVSDGENHEAHNEEDSLDFLDQTNREINVDSGFKATKRRSARNEAKFTCPHCSMTFVYAESKIKHLSEYHGVRQSMSDKEQEDSEDEPKVADVKYHAYYCPLCNADFRDPKSLTAHILEQKCSNKRYKSQNDELESTYDEEERKFTQQSLDDSEKEHVDAKKSKYYCPLCMAVFLDSKPLVSHILEQKCNTNPKKFKNAFVSLKKFDVHIQTHKMKHICGICNKTFDSQRDVIQHKIKQHKFKKYQCSICKSSFQYASNLGAHVRRHANERLFFCSDCKKNFCNPEELSSHKLWHTQTMPWRCKICSRSFVNKVDLHIHIRRHNGERLYVCNICKKGLPSGSSLTKHKLIHTEGKPHACDLCPMRFYKKGILHEHQQTHASERAYKCIICNSTFEQLYQCVDHMQTHTGELGYACQICYKQFARSHHLLTHTRVHKKTKGNVSRESNGKR